MAQNNSIDEGLRVGVVGLGPTGCILTTHLVEAGAHVIPCDIITDRIDAIKRSGIRLEQAIEKHVHIIDACCSVQELEQYNPELVVIAVKASFLSGVLHQLAESSLRNAFVMCAQNGIDNEVVAARVLGDDRILRMVLNYAGNMSDMSTVQVNFFNPPNYVAALTPQGNAIAERFAALLTSAGLDTEIPNDIKDYVWEKGILNAILGPVCAITGHTMKDVMDFPPAIELIEAIVDESVRVAEAEGIDLGKEFRRFCMEYLKNAGYHRPSILVDIDEGRTTEIDWLNGKIVEYGRKHSIPTPLSLSITVMIHLLERKR